MKPSDLNLWSTETDDKVQEKLYEYYPTQLPHPVCFCVCYNCSSGRMMAERSWMIMKQRVFLHALERCISGSVQRRWRMDFGKEVPHLFNANVYCPFVPTNNGRLH